MRPKSKESHLCPLTPLDADRLVHTSHTPPSSVCDVWARACARVVGGVCLAVACRHVSVVVIIRTREALNTGRSGPGRSRIRAVVVGRAAERLDVAPHRRGVYARVVGGFRRLAIARRHVSVIVIETAIIRTREALQVRKRASQSADTNGRRGGGGVSGGDGASIAVIQDEVQVVL